ncbi:hypothetical protein VCRA2110O318_40056 [Vibrio crassostreae]|nr:hypothetical protein VCRA2117O328_40055 [Vibrio crassostreae]CAK2335338.1 hypothetical protein VCRA2110O318_40056 [Vibrio crassostreae]CAK2503769.1 hypothetical protein VCRA2110O319_50056 [Vibrio crassostreae]CAK2910026.1 hypothetical protein VCRA217O317_30237 [Vibrio crassostreae]
MANVSFTTRTPNTGEAYLLKDLVMDDVISQDGFHLAIRNTRDGVMVIPFLDLGNGLVEGIKPTTYIKEVVCNYFGLDSVSYKHQVHRRQTKKTP